MKEREIKLSAGERFELPDLSAVRGVVASPRTEQRLSTVYLDSDDFRLARWGLSFRHRGGQGWTEGVHQARVATRRLRSM